MSGLRQKVAVYLGLAEEDEYDSFDYDSPRRPVDHDDDRPAPPRTHDTVSVQRDTPRDSFASTARPRARRIESAYDVVKVAPSAYSDVASIGKSFRAGDPIAMDLTRLSADDARRMIDFASGLTFGLDGAIRRLGGKVFLLTPKGVEVSESVQGDLLAAS